MRGPKQRKDIFGDQIAERDTFSELSLFRISATEYE